jgi:hypothetical protein
MQRIRSSIDIGICVGSTPTAEQIAAQSQEQWSAAVASRLSHHHPTPLIHD